MDCAFNWEYKTVVLINELTQGVEHTKQLRAYMSSVASSTCESSQELLLQKILSSYERSLLILKGSTSGSAIQPSQPLPPTESPVSADGNRRSDHMNKRSLKEHQETVNISKKSRKSQLKGIELVRVSAESPGSERPIDDGYSWRKYGHKDILQAKYPRCYYRCKLRYMHNCYATKQVQRSNDDPTVLEITYKGYHTCQQVPNSALQPTSPENQANHPTDQSNQLLFTDHITDRNQQFQISAHDNYLIGGCSSSFVSPTTTDVGVVLSLYHSESDRTNIFSANTSTTSSSFIDDFTRSSLGATSRLFPIC